MDRKVVAYFFPDILGQAVALAQAREDRQGTHALGPGGALSAASRLSLLLQW